MITEFYFKSVSCWDDMTFMIWFCTNSGKRILLTLVQEISISYYFFKVLYQMYGQNLLKHLSYIKNILMTTFPKFIHVKQDLMIKIISIHFIHIYSFVKYRQKQLGTITWTVISFHHDMIMRSTNFITTHIILAVILNTCVKIHTWHLWWIYEKN